MTPTIRSIVCGVDGSPASPIGHGVLLHAVADPPPFPYGDARVAELGRRRTIDAGLRVVEQIAAEWDAVPMVRLGEPADCLPSPGT